MQKTKKFALIICLLLAGCTAIGGAPEPSFDINSDLRQLAEQFGNATSITGYYSIPIEGRRDARNKFVAGRIVQIDLRYIEYTRALSADRQKLDSATQLGAMTLGIAGTLTGGVQAKANLAAGVTALTGSQAIIDKNFFYEKSVDALLAMMNAKRKEVLVAILPSLNLSIDQYPLENAIKDLHSYYMAGTLHAAVQAVSVQASLSEQKSDALLRNYELSPFTRTDVEKISTLTNSIDKLVFPQAVSILTALDVPRDKIPKTLEDVGSEVGAKRLLKEKVRSALSEMAVDKRTSEIERLITIFKASGVWKEL